MSTDLKFFFCDQELPYYSSFWWVIDNNLFKDFYDLNNWDKYCLACLNEIDWKLDKVGVPYSYDADIFVVLALKIRKYLEQGKKVFREINDVDLDELMSQLKNGLEMMIQIADEKKYVWWLIDETNHFSFDKDNCPHLIARDNNVKEDKKWLTKRH